MRIQLDLPDEDVLEIKDLMKRAGIDTYKELFSNALGLLNWVVAESEKGREVASLDESNQYRTLAMPMLSRIARRAARGAEAGR